MTEIQKKERAFVAQKIRDTADQVYEQMYGGWKTEHLEPLHIAPPDKLVFDYDIYALLPQKYMAGVHGYHSNVLYDAANTYNMGKVADIIQKTQYMSIKEFAEQYDVDSEIVKMEWRTMWTLVTGCGTTRKIPVAIADAFYKWMTKKVIPARQYAKSKVVVQGGRNLDAVKEVIEALNLVQGCLLIENNSRFDFDMAAYELYTHGHAEMIRELREIWQT